MVKNYQACITLLWALVVLTAALPQHSIDKVATPGQSADATGPFDLPFLQFKNGGIRVNFAGYHAEAGLGGLLGGSDAKGGLYASAGTPWGPAASAGLGGSLGGQDGTARGGLHARATLGNGRPGAGAGLGGSLDGSGRSASRASGGLYAGATAGGPEAAAGLGGSLDGSGAPGGNTGSLYAGATDGIKTKTSVKQVSHIQSVPPSKEKVYLTKSGEKDAATTLEFKLPAVKANQELSSSIVTREIGNPGSKYEVTGANGVVADSDAQDNADLSYPARRYYRKRYRNNPTRKHSFYKFFTTNTGPVAELPAASASAKLESGIVTGKTYDDRVVATGSSNVPYGVVTKAKSTTLFDDIFNIPISTLTAVNQLLNNKSG